MGFAPEALEVAAPIMKRVEAKRRMRPLGSQQGDAAVGAEGGHFPTLIPRRALRI
jgi:hypothetical protein